jgi:hypothetical protein
MSDSGEGRLEARIARRRAAGVLAGVMFFAALYVASAGPVALCVHKSGVATTPGWPDSTLCKSIEVLYAPLVWLMHSGTAPGNWLFWYAMWWLSL